MVDVSLEWWLDGGSIVDPDYPAAFAGVNGAPDPVDDEEGEVCDGACLC